MTITELINAYLKKCPNEQEQTLSSVNTDKNIPIPETIIRFLNKLSSNEELSEGEVYVAFTELHRIEHKNIRQCIISIFRCLAGKIYDDYEQQISESSWAIDKQLAVKNAQLQFDEVGNYKPFIGLLNAHICMSYALKEEYDYCLLNADLKEKMINIAFGINALVLTNKLPKSLKYCGLDLSKAICPCYFKTLDSPKTYPIRCNIKQRNDFYPYKAASAITYDDSNENTFVATNGKTILYMRGIKLA